MPTQGGFASENWAVAGRTPNTTVMAAAQISATHQPRRQTSPGRASIARGHYPSSWYKSTTKPVSPPASTGNHAADGGVHQLSLAQILSYFRQYIKQKARRYATQNHSRDAAKAEEP